MEESGPTIDPEACLEHAKWVLALARRIAGDEGRAEDAAQDALAAALAHPPQRGIPVRSWLAKVLRNAVARSLRGDARRRRREAAAARTDVAPVGPTLTRAETFRAVVDAVVALPEHYRAVVLLRHFEGRSTAEAARRLDIPVETARTRLKRAYAMLRAELDREHGGDRSARAPLLLLGRSGGKTGAAIPVPAAIAGGALVMKKLALVAAVLLLLGGGGAVLRLAGPGDPARSPSAAPPTAALSDAARGGIDAPDRTGPDAGEQPAGPVLTGTVRDARGDPVPGAAVLASASRPSEGPPWSGEAAGKAGDDGRFVLALPDTSPLFDLLASAPGLAPGRRLRVRPGEEIDLVLGRTDRLTGRVLDLGGRPVAGAGVCWIWRGAGGGFVRSAESGPDGSFTLAGIPAEPARAGDADGSGGCFTVSAKGFAPLTVTWAHAGWRPGRRSVDLYVGRGAAVNGLVADAETGEPLSGAAVRLTLFGVPALEPVPGSGGLAREASGSGPARVAASDEEGRFHFEAIPALCFHSPGASGQVRPGAVVASAPGYAPARVDLVYLADGEVGDVRIPLRPAATLTGRVVDGAGAPVAGVRVQAAVAGIESGGALGAAPLPASARTGPDGRYRLESLPALRERPVDVEIVARLRGEAVNTIREARVGIRVRAGEEVAAPDLVLPDGRVRDPRVALLVVDGSGAPIWGAAVARWRSGHEVLTGRDGVARYVFGEMPGAPAPDEYRLFVAAPGFAAVETPPLKPAVLDPPVVRVVLLRGRALSGRVEYQDGGPADAFVFAFPAGGVPEEVLGESDSAVLPFPVPAGAPAPERLASAGTSAGGAFVLEDLPRSPVDLLVVVCGSSDGLYADRAYRAAMRGVGPQAHNVRFRVPRPPAMLTASLRLTVRDAATGDAVPRFWVELERKGAEAERVPRQDAVPAPGEWRSAIPPGDYRVRIGARGYVSRERQVRVPADGPPVTLSVALSRGTTVRGRVVLAGRDRSSGTVSFRAVHGETAGVVQWGSFGPDGHFEVAGLGPGRYRVDVGIAGGRPVATPEPVEVVAPAGGGEITIDLEAVAAAEIDVRIEVDGAPAPDFDRVRIRATDRVGRVTADRAASYPRLVVPPGTFTLTLSVPGLPEECRDVTVAAGDRRTVVFRLR